MSISNPTQIKFPASAFGVCDLVRSNPVRSGTDYLENLIFACTVKHLCMYFADIFCSKHKFRQKMRLRNSFESSYREHSGSAEECLNRDRGAAGSASLCFALEQDTFILALHWFNPGRPVST